MNKTITITLAGQLFYVEEHAYQKLDEYLKSVKNYFASYPESDEITADIEARIAEQFAGKNQGSKEKVVSEADVDALIGVMGRVEDFGYEGDSKANAPAAPSAGPKKLLRNPDDTIIAGVCSGIAAYFGWDPAIVRLIFAITVFFGGGGILLYLLLWLAMPEAKTTTEKMQMRGVNVTLQSFKETIKERAKEVNEAKGPVKNFLTDLFSAIGKVIKVLATVLVKVIGAAIAIGAAAGLIGLTFALVAILFNINSPYVDFPIRELFSGVPYYIGLFSLYFVLLIPAILVLMAATLLLSKTYAASKAIVFGLLIVWVASLITGGALATRYVPEIQDRYNSLPEYQSVNRDYPRLNGFDKINVSGANKIIAKPGKEFSVVAHGRQKDLERVTIEVRDGALVVEWPQARVCLLCLNDTVTVDVIMPGLTAIEASGASRVEAKGFASSSFFTKLSGSSRSILELRAEQITAEISGASRMEISGTTTGLKATASGASRFEGAGLQTETATFDLSGASRAHIYATKEITVKASGASRLYFQGDPQIKQNLSGSSKVYNEGWEEPEGFQELEGPVFVPATPEPAYQ